MSTGDATAGARPYLSVCAIYLNEAPYLREWIEFHRLVGVERFFLYDNGSSDDHLDLLAPYLEAGIVILHDRSVFAFQKGAYEHCLSAHGDESRWIAFIDTDEFLFSPAGRPLPEHLREYERWPGVAVNRANFGTSGHKEKPEGLVIENYLLRFDQHPSVKCVVDPARVERYQNPHWFVYRDAGFAVDEHFRRLDRWFTDEYTLARLRVNHYIAKSEEEFERKLQRERADTGKMPEQPANISRAIGKIRDEAITTYVPALREALADPGAPVR